MNFFSFYAIIKKIHINRMEKKMDLFKENAVVRIRKGAGRSLKAGGAWIYDNEIEAIEGEFRCV